LLDLKGQGSNNLSVAELTSKAFDLLRSELYKTNAFSQEGNPLDPVFKLNKAVLTFFDQSNADIALYEKS
jgi:hypothetical protein